MIKKYKLHIYIYIYIYGGDEVLYNYFLNILKKYIF